MDRFADRCFISINGQEQINVISARCTRVENRRAVPGMTRNRRDLGFIEGNVSVRGAFTLAIPASDTPSIIEQIDFGAYDVFAVFEFGAFSGGTDRVTVGPLWLNDSDRNSPAVGTEATKTYEFAALELFSSTMSSVTDRIGHARHGR